MCTLTLGSICVLSLAIGYCLFFSADIQAQFSTSSPRPSAGIYCARYTPDCWYNCIKKGFTTFNNTFYTFDIRLFFVLFVLSKSSDVAATTTDELSCTCEQPTSKVLRTRMNNLFSLVIFSIRNVAGKHRKQWKHILNKEKVSLENLYNLHEL